MNSSCFIICELKWIVFMAIYIHVSKAFSCQNEVNVFLLAGVETNGSSPQPSEISVLASRF